MTTTSLPRSAADPSICDREPIHIPGFIQPQGALLTVRAGDLLVTQISANFTSVLGPTAEISPGRRLEGILGRPLQDVLGREARVAIEDLISRDGLGPRNVCSLPGSVGSQLSLRAHRCGQVICIEIEALARDPPRGRSAVGMMQSIMGALSGATSLDQLCAVAAREFKALTGYDRVMIYRFDEDGKGEVVGEALDPDLTPFMGLHYPATDIPLPARQIFLRQHVRLIADIDYVPVPILWDPALHDGVPLDMTLCALRAVSPVHIEYLRNMGVTASFSVALTNADKLWGLILGHHGTPRWMDSEHRAAIDLIGQMMASLVQNILGSETNDRKTRFSEWMRSLGPRLVVSAHLCDALAAPETELLRITQADGAVIRVGGHLRSLGRTPPAADSLLALALLSREATGDLLAVNDLGLRFPELASCIPAGSGALLLPLLPSTDDVILWFRPEALQTLTWGGEPNQADAKFASRENFSPRKSFDAWKELIRGHSLRWSHLDLTFARELKSVIEIAAVERKKEQQRLLEVKILVLEANLLASAVTLASSQAETKFDPADLLVSQGLNKAVGHSHERLTANEKSMRESETRFRRVIEATHSAMVVINGSGMIWLVNSEAERVFGYRRDEILGKPAEILIPERFRGHHPALRAAFFANERESRPMGVGRDLFGLRKDGTEFPLEIGLNPVETEEGMMVLSTVTDISERREMELLREQQRRALERSNADLEDFAYIASHDLKEPLRGIASNARFLIEDYAEQLDQDGINRLRRLAFLSQRMEQLINDLFHFAQLSQSEPALELIDLNAVIRDIEIMSDTMLKERHADIVIARQLPMVLCNQMRITEVFRNLITNAIKYNNNDIRHVEIGYYDEIKRIAGMERRVFYVKDNGIGIEREFYDDIFRIFRRLNAEDDDKKGTGVGLTFVRRIVERDGGQIWLDSAPGVGTTFYFTMNTGIG